MIECWDELVDSLEDYLFAKQYNESIYADEPDGAFVKYEAMDRYGTAKINLEEKLRAYITRVVEETISARL